jgi:hypothetical protein
MAPEESAGAAGSGGEPSVTLDFEPVAELTPQEQEYLEFLSDAEQARYERMVECFGVSDSDYLVTGDADRLLAQVIAQRPGLRLKTVAFDATQAAECLRAIEEASCQGLAEHRQFYECVVLIGQVPPGGPCLGDSDCQAPDSYVCRAGAGSDSRCERHCIARDETPPAGDLDEPCRFDNCLPGLYCRFSARGDVAGFCRSYAPGGECAGVWQCPYPYACDFSDGSSVGTCAIGRGVGDACQIGDDYNGRHSNCALTLSCYAEGAEDLTCAPGRELGEACGQEAGAGMFIKCHVGYCRPAEAPEVSTCVLRRSVGEPCVQPADCRSLLCQSGVCGPVERRIGSPCESQDDCGLESFCRFDVDNLDVAEPLGPGSCQASRRIGEKCSDSEYCEQLSQCVDGACQRCPG